ncbi:hypothetical protein DFH06DRAFT_1435059 [Mycena polygramma]|nr:hypothetical protein DFH06DRAFT_1435059 [Mycena polygramma]
MSIRRSITRRDIVLLLLGATFTLFVSPFFSLHTLPQAIITDTDTFHQVASNTAESSLVNSLDVQGLRSTSIVAHAPGWTIFRNLYMSNGTFFIVSDSESDWPEIRLMASTPLPAEDNPYNIAMREPTPYHMAFLSSADAQRRWGVDSQIGRKPRVFSVDGNTVLVNEPSQFLRHYYHLVAELVFGIQAFWHGAFSEPSFDADREYMLGPHPAPPPIHRVIFARTNADGWRDNPGFNAYFMRGAAPAITIEVEEDWKDRVAITSSGDRAWHFPLLLLTDRSASFRGPICGGQTQRIASEAVEFMRSKGRLAGARVGGWWEPVRSAMLRFAGADVFTPEYTDQGALSGDAAVGDPRLPMPKKIVITYISRQSAHVRRLTPQSHDGVVDALRQLVRDKGAAWELNVIEAEKLSHDEQLRIIARTTILLGVHGNGLTHLVMMQPTRFSSVIEIFYPTGFAHDYQWTSSALGIKHFAVWNDTYRTEGVGEGKPPYSYPEGFQGRSIPAHGPAIVQLIEDQVAGRL